MSDSRSDVRFQKKVGKIGGKDEPGEAARPISNRMSETSEFEERLEEGTKMDT